MTTPRNESKSSLYLSYSILGVIFLVDCFFAFGMFGGIPYVVGLVLLMWLLKPSQVMYFSAACAGLAITAFLMSEDLSELSGLLNRFMAIFANIAIAMLVKRHTEVVERKEEKQRHLDSVIEKRTEGLKQVVDQLEENKIRLSEAEQLGHFGFWEFYPSTQEMIWSNGVFAIYGFPVTPQAPSMQEFLDQCHTDDVVTLQRSIQYGLAEKKPYTVEYRVIMPDGSVKWIFNKGRPIVGKNGLVDMLVGTIQDVTNLKHSEESVQANRARYTTLFKSAGVGKVLMIPNKRILEANRAFAKWVGYSEKSLMKIPLEKLMHEDDRIMDNAYARDMVSGDLDFYQKEKRFIRRDGTILWGLFSVSPVHDAEDKITCFAAEIVDITGHKNLQMAFQKAQESWHEAEDALTENESALRLAEKKLEESEEARLAAEEKLEQYMQAGPPPASRPAELYESDAPAQETFEAPGFVEPAYDDDFEASEFEDPEYADPVYEAPDDENIASEAPEEVQRRVQEQRIYDLSQPDKEPVRVPVSAEPASASTPPARRSLSGEMPEEEARNLFMGRDLIAVLGFDSCYRRVSPKLTSELGYSVEEMTDQHMLNYIHQDDRSVVQEHLRNLRDGVNVSGLQMRHMTKFEGYRRFMWTATVNEEYGVVISSLKPAIEFDFGEPAPEPTTTMTSAEAPVEAPLTSEEPVHDEQAYEEPVFEEPLYEEPAYQAPAFQEPPFDEPVYSDRGDGMPDTRPQEYESVEYEQPAYESAGYGQEPPAHLETGPEPAGIEPVSAGHAKPEPAEPIAAPLPIQQQMPRKPRPPRAPLPVKLAPPEAPPLRAPAAHEVDWHRLTDRMPFQVWMLGPDRSCRYVNKKVRDFTGLPFEQLEGKGWSKTVHPEDYRNYVAYYKSAFDKWQPMACMYRLRRNDGTYRWMQESSVPLQRADGSYEGYLVTCMEITLLKTTAEKFERAFKGAVNLLDLKSALHPCQKEDSQHVLTDSVKIGDALVGNAREVPNIFLARLMEYAGLRLLYMVKETLCFYNADKDDHNLLKRAISLDEALDSTVEMLAPLRRADGTRFQVLKDETETTVSVDKVLVHRLFENLLRNLLEWAESRVVTVEIYKSGSQGIVEIKHIGQVLDPGFLMSLDDIYRKGATSLLQRKAGLELSLIRRLAEAMDGGMRILNDEDRDPMIEIWFELAEVEAPADTPPAVKSSVPKASVPKAPDRPAPVAKPEPQRASAPVQREEPVQRPEPIPVPEPVQQAAPPRPPASPQEEDILIHENGVNGKSIARHRVLVGETNSETQRLVRSLLQPYYDLTIVPSTDAILEQAERSQYDLLLLDVHLQGDHSGVDVLKELRRRPQYTRIPAIAVAANTTAIDQRDLIDRAGFDGFLRKPYSIVELLETVERMIES